MVDDWHTGVEDGNQEFLPVTKQYASWRVECQQMLLEGHLNGYLLAQLGARQA